MYRHRGRRAQRPIPLPRCVSECYTLAHLIPRYPVHTGTWGTLETFTPAVRANKVCTARRAKRNTQLSWRPRSPPPRRTRRWQVHAGGEVYGCGVPAAPVRQRLRPLGCTVLHLAGPIELRASDAAASAAPSSGSARPSTHPPPTRSVTSTCRCSPTRRCSPEHAICCYELVACRAGPSGGGERVSGEAPTYLTRTFTEVARGVL